VRRVVALIKGPPGHPVHPPLTDVTIGALTLATLTVVLAWVGVLPHLLVPTASVSLVVGLVLAVPTATTGLIDLLDLPPGSAVRTTGLIHMGAMVTALLAFLVLLLLLLGPGSDATDGVPGAAVVTSLVAFAFLTVGGWIGGALVFGHGTRVVGDPETPTRRVLDPRRRQGGRR
jgi:uncharacterized membrane protein